MKTIKQRNLNRAFWGAEAWTLIILVCSLIYSYLDFTSSMVVFAFALVAFKFSKLPVIFDGEFILLFLTFLSFFFIRFLYHDRALLWAVYDCATPLLLYILGRYFTYRWQSSELFLTLMLSLAIALSAYHIIVTVQDIFVVGIVNPIRTLEILDDFGNQIPVTQRVLALSLNFMGFSLLLYKPENNYQKTIKIVFLGLALISLLCSLHYVSRTGVVLSVVSIVLGIILFRRFEIRSILIIGGLIVVVFILLQNSDIMQVIGLYDERNARMEDNYGGRSFQWLNAWDDMWANPFGKKTDYYAHNLWLDFGRELGPIPFFLLVLFSLSNVLKSIKIARNRHYPLLVRNSVVCFSLIFFLGNFTECILNGIYHYLFVYVIYCGMVNSISKWDKSIKSFKYNNQ